MLSEIAEDFVKADDSGPAVEKQLAEFINNLWSKKFSDTTLKEKSAKYLRPVNGETLTTPRVNPEIWEKLSHSGKQQDLRSSSIQKTVNCAGAHIDLSHRRRESIKPHLPVNKDYAGICASHVPITALLFGEDLQTQLNNIRASNRVSDTAVGNRHKQRRDTLRETTKDLIGEPSLF